MRNTGIIYSSTERTPTILPEMADLLPPLTGEQIAALEVDILANGCYSPVIINEDMVIIDGHNRQRLCEQHGLTSSEQKHMIPYILGQWPEPRAGAGTGQLYRPAAAPPDAEAVHAHDGYQLRFQCGRGH